MVVLVEQEEVALPTHQLLLPEEQADGLMH
jgi:hypothetical protein